MSDIRQITLFGATGFIGRHTIRRLARRGAVIRVPTRDPEKALLLKPMGDVGQIVPMACSVRSDAAVSAAIAKSDVVINLLGILYEHGRNTFQAVHVEAAARIARLAREQGVRHFVQISALGASATSPSAYARSKFAGEEAVKAFFPDAVLLRPSVVFGPEDDFFNRFAAMACLAHALPLIGGGHTRFQTVYVGDVAEAVCRVLEKPPSVGDVFELGGPGIYTFRNLMEIMMRAINRNCLLMDLPWPLAKLMAAFMELAPHPLLTRDQVDLLKKDNVVSEAGVKTFRDLGLHPTALEVILPAYLGRYRKV